MANRRMISSEIFLDDWFGNLSNFERILWIGLFAACADDQGRFIFAPAAIRAQVFPYDDIDLGDIQEAMDKFIADAKIAVYQPEGAKRIYAQIVKWWEYQKPSWAMPSKYPAPAGWMDRAKYHIIPSKVITLNWDKPGGYAPGNPLPQVLPDALRSPLPNPLSGGIDELSRDELRREEKGVENPAATAPFSPPIINPPPITDPNALVMVVLREACNFIAIPPTEQARHGQIASMIQYFGRDPTSAELKRQFEKWTATKRKDNGGSYKSTNMAWVDWAQDALQRTKQPDDDNPDGWMNLHGKELDEWFLRHPQTSPKN